MRAILEFELPDDETEFKLCTRGKDYYLVLWDLDQWLREKIKYGAEDSINIDTLEAVRETLHELLQNRNVSLDDIN
jgi:hypothetical protein